MLSEGRPGVDDLYTLKDSMQITSPRSLEIRHCFSNSVVEELIIRHSGILRLELGKENYERCGLTGKPICDGGRKHIKTRFGRHDSQEKTYGLLTQQLRSTYGYLLCFTGKGGSKESSGRSKTFSLALSRGFFMISWMVLKD